MSGQTIVKRVLIGILAAVALVYLGDSLSVWYRMSKKTAGDPLTTMTTQGTIEIPHKDGRAEIVLADPVTQTCVRAIFPHDGYNPCWYVARQNQSTTVITLLPLAPLARRTRPGH
ncbi:MAG: hypothetical protein WBF35_04955 [Candidatus Acidiferrales bacterium]